MSSVSLSWGSVNILSILVLSLRLSHTHTFGHLGQDLRTLRTLAAYLTAYDAITFLAYLEVKHMRASSKAIVRCTWVHKYTEHGVHASHQQAFIGAQEKHHGFLHGSTVGAVRLRIKLLLQKLTANILACTVCIHALKAKHSCLIKLFSCIFLMSIFIS